MAFTDRMAMMGHSEARMTALYTADDLQRRRTVLDQMADRLLPTKVTKGARTRLSRKPRRSVSGVPASFRPGRAGGGGAGQGGARLGAPAPSDGGAAGKRGRFPEGCGPVPPCADHRSEPRGRSSGAGSGPHEQLNG